MAIQYLGIKGSPSAIPPLSADFRGISSKIPLLDNTNTLPTNPYTITLFRCSKFSTSLQAILNAQCKSRLEWSFDFSSFPLLVDNLAVQQLGAIFGTSLKSVILDDCVSLSEEAIVFLLSNCSNQLESISLANIPQVAEKTIEALSEFSGIKTVSLRNNRMVTTQSLVNLFGKLKKLEQVKIVYMRQLTDELLVALANNSQKLQLLHLQDCDGFSDDGITTITSNSLLLEDLNLAYCKKLTDSSIKQLGKLSELKIISLDGCHRITDESLESLHQCKKLERAKLFCGRITDDGIATLKKVLPNIQVEGR